MRSAELAGIQAGMEKSADMRGAFDRWNKSPHKAEDLILGVPAAAAAGVAAYDTYKSWGVGKDQRSTEKALKGKNGAVDAKQFIRKHDPKVFVATTESDVKMVIKKEKGIPKEDRAIAIAMLSRMVRSKENAAALRGEFGEYIFSAPMMNPEILGHELGHIWDFRSKGINFKQMGPYKERALSGIWRPSFNKEIMRAEQEAWRLSPHKEDGSKLEESALGTYDKGFHQGRGMAAGAVAAMLAFTLIKVRLDQ
jgi:hypothetical protein